MNHCRIRGKSDVSIKIENGDINACGLFFQTAELLANFVVIAYSQRIKRAAFDDGYQVFTGLLSLALNN